MKIFVTWNEVESFVDGVVEKYCDKNITGVFGMPRGGLVLAVMISHRLNVPMLMSPVHNCMIVDDIVDSGETLLHYHNNTSGNECNKYNLVTMFYKKNDLGVTPDYWSHEKLNNWIVFPWEEKED